MTSPIVQVKDAISSGTTTRAGIAHVTGLKIGTVNLVISHLLSTGELNAETLNSCPTSGCGSCAAAAHCGTASANPGRKRGPVLLSLRRPRPAPAS